MCDGKIVAPVGRNRYSVKRKFNLMSVLKMFLDRITYYSAVNLDSSSKVNMCPECGDLEIKKIWQKIPQPQKLNISREVGAGSISINGRQLACDFCTSMREEIREKQKNLYEDKSFIPDFEQVTSVSSMSF